MPEPEAQKAVEAMAKKVASLDKSTASHIIGEYGAVYTALQKEAVKIVNIGQQRKLKSEEVDKMARLTKLENQLINNVDRFGKIAGEAVTTGQRVAVGLSVQGAASVASASLPTGITLNNLAAIGIEWNRLPEEAFEAFIGISGDGKPVGNLLAELGRPAANKVKESIRTGIVTGKSPREVATVIRQVAGMPLSRALTISRTEINRAHREATRLNYAANSNIVKGYRRLATKDATTCMACIALDGTVYENNEPLDSHPNCRCAMVPATLTYQDLGLDIPEEPHAPTGQEWFNSQSKTVQEKMMGKKQFAAFQQGKIKIDDLVTTTTSPIWGKSSTVKSVKALGL